MRLERTIACGVVLGLAVGCEVPPHLSPTLENVAAGGYAVGFERCSRQWPLEIAEITVTRLDGGREVSECKLSYTYPAKGYAMLQSSAVWNYGAPLDKYQLSGDCSPLRKAARYRIEVDHVSVALVERSIVDVDATGAVHVVKRSCDAHQ